MKKLLVLLAVLLLVGCTTKPAVETVPKETGDSVVFDKTQYPNLTFEDYEKALAEKKDGIYYFSWVEGCGDSRNFQKNYLVELLSKNPELVKHFYVIDLDIENPEGLRDHEKRKDMKAKYQVAYSPTLHWIKDGEIAETISWTPMTSDPVTAIPVADLEAFFAKTGYLN